MHAHTRNPTTLHPQYSLNPGSHNLVATNFDVVPEISIKTKQKLDENAQQKPQKKLQYFCKKEKAPENATQSMKRMSMATTAGLKFRVCVSLGFVSV